MTTELVYLSVASPFSQEVFRLIRPHIPRERWPTAALPVTFTADVSGLFLLASFDDDGLPAASRKVAVQVIAHAGVELVVKSPFALLAAATMRAKRWRDAFMFLAVPLLFAIPLLGALSGQLMIPATGLFAADLLALILAQVQLTHRRMALAEARCVAEIPVPGLRINPSMKGPEPLDPDKLD
ncbi:MAG: hypothetical protein LDL39_06930 [Magnetospirillum sp.]|nr:hypothetical protein [Magnetospirillum sp.]